METHIILEEFITNLYLDKHQDITTLNYIRKWKITARGKKRHFWRQ